MWVEPYLLAPAIQLVLGQRLVRKVCPNCSTRRPATYAEQTEIEQALKRLNDAWISDLPAFDGTIVTTQWCSHCNETWYQGRLAILEALEITDDMRNLIVDRESEAWILTKARANWFITLQEDWIIKVLRWETTLDEIHRVIE